VSAWTHIRYSLRGLARTPGSTLVLVVSIALGLGSNAIVAGFVRGLVTAEFPIDSPDRAIAVFSRETDGSYGPSSFDTYAGLRGRTTEFALLGAAAESRAQISVGGHSTVATVARLTPAAAELLGLQIEGGAAISHRLSQETFSGKSVEGESVTIDGGIRAIGAVAPEWLSGVFTGNPIDVWILTDPASDTSDTGARIWWILGRLAGEVDLDTAQRKVNATRSGAELLAMLPYNGVRPETASAQRRIGILLTSAAGFVLLIACVNVATFLLARAMMRARETAVRVAIGASRRQLAAGLLSDALVLGVMGGTAGILFAVWTGNILPAFLFEADATDLRFVTDRRWLLLASALCLGATVLCGLAPLLEVRRDDPAAVLRRESAGPSPRGRGIRTLLVIGQMTICCILIVAAGLLVVRFREALRTAAGQRLGPAILVTVEAGARFARDDLGRSYFEEVERAAMSIPEVHEAAWTGTPPGGRPTSVPVRVEPPPDAYRDVTIAAAAFRPESLSEIDPNPLAGRLFGGLDRAGGCRVVVINDVAATRLLGGDAVGRIMRDPLGGIVEVIGVVALRPRADGRHREPFVYYYAPQLPSDQDFSSPRVFGVPAWARSKVHVIDMMVVSPNYLRLVDVETVQGTPPSDEPGPDACRTGVVNEAAMRRMFAGSALGGALIDAAGHRTTITGVVSTTDLRVGQRATQPALYLATGQEFVPRMSLLLRARAVNADVLARVGRSVAAVKGGRMPPVVVSLDVHLARTALSAERIAMILVSASAVIGIFLGVFGLYGAMSDAGRHRRREFAVRSALGARSRHIAGEVLRDGLRLATAGVAIGLLGSVLVERWLSTLLHQSDSRPALVWIAPLPVLLLSVLIASVLPALRAIAVSPLTVMKEE
jgi:putative ABC transport system permease protein